MAPEVPTLVLADASDTGVAGDGVTSEDAPTLTGTAEGGSTVTIFADGEEIGTAEADEDGAFTFTVPDAFADGDVVFTATATDVASNVSEASDALTVTIDTTAPTAPGIALATDTGANTTDGITSDATVNVTGLESSATWEYSVNDGVSFVAGTGTSFELPAGTYAAGDIQVRQTDVAGTTSSVGVNLAAITVDTTAPTVAITTSVSDDTVNAGDGPVAVTFTFSEAPIGFSQGDITAFGGAISNVETTGNPLVYTATFIAAEDFDGAASISIAAGRFRDSAGNTNVASEVEFAVDTQAPGATVVLDPVTDDNVVSAGEADGTVAITGQVTGEFQTGDVVTITLDGTTVNTGALREDGTFSVNVDGAVLAEADEPTLGVSVAVTDAAGNVATTSGTQAYDVDVSPPVASVSLDAVATDDIVNAAEAVDETVAITGRVTGEFQTGDAVTLFLGEDEVGTGTLLEDGTFTVNVDGADLADAGDTRLIVTVLVNDDAGNGFTVFNDRAYTVDLAPPAAPTLFLDPASDSGTQGDGVTNDTTPTLTGTVEAGSTVAIFNGATLLGAATVEGTTFNFTSAALANGTVNSFTAVATDAAGNVGSASAPVSVTIDAPANPGGGGGGGGGTPPVAPPIEGTAGADTITGVPGQNNVISAGAGNDTVFAGSGNDTVNGNADDDAVNGGQGNDLVQGGQGNDLVQGGQGNDSVFGDNGNDRVFGDLGDDVVNGNAGNDTVNGGQGDDLVRGGQGDDLVSGGQGNDQLFGDLGNDLLNGDLGNDFLTGGAGSDVFQFSTSSGADVVTDFDFNQGDRLDLQGQSYVVGENNEGVATLFLSGGGTVVLLGYEPDQFQANFVIA